MQLLISVALGHHFSKFNMNVNCQGLLLKSLQFPIAEQLLEEAEMVSPHLGLAQHMPDTGKWLDTCFGSTQVSIIQITDIQEHILSRVLIRRIHFCSFCFSNFYIYQNKRRRQSFSEASQFRMSQVSEQVYSLVKSFWLLGIGLNIIITLDCLLPALPWQCDMGLIISKIGQ